MTADEECDRLVSELSEWEAGCRAVHALADLRDAAAELDADEHAKIRRILTHLFPEAA